jgi:hypothetical protein
LDCDGYRFLLLPIFDRVPVSRDIDCCSLAKISEILAGTDILLTPIFLMLLHGGPVQMSTAARSRQDSLASPAKKIRLLEKKLGRKPASPQTIRRNVVKIYVCKLLGQFLPIILKIRPHLGN